MCSPGYSAFVGWLTGWLLRRSRVAVVIVHISSQKEAPAAVGGAVALPATTASANAAFSTPAANAESSPAKSANSTRIRAVGSRVMGDVPSRTSATSAAGGREEQVVTTCV